MFKGRKSVSVQIDSFTICCCRMTCCCIVVVRSIPAGCSHPIVCSNFAGHIHCVFCDSPVDHSECSISSSPWLAWSAWVVVTSVYEMLSLKIFSNSFDGD